MAINTIDDVVSGLGNSSQIVVISCVTGAVTNGQYQSLWTGAAGVPGGGDAAPPLYNSGGPYTCSSGTVGALHILPAVNQNYIASMAMANSVVATYVLADRLWSASIGTAAATTYTITTPGSLPTRITDNGVGCQIWIETLVGGTQVAGTYQVNYVDSNGVSRSSAATAGIANPASGLMRQLVHAPGAYGVSQITSVTRTGSQGAANTIAVTIMKPILAISAMDVTEVLDWAETRLVKLSNDGCYMLYKYAPTGTASATWGFITIVDK